MSVSRSRSWRSWVSRSSRVVVRGLRTPCGASPGRGGSGPAKVLGVSVVGVRGALVPGVLGHGGQEVTGTSRSCSTSSPARARPPVWTKAARGRSDCSGVRSRSGSSASAAATCCGTQFTEPRWWLAIGLVLGVAAVFVAFRRRSFSTLWFAALLAVGFPAAVLAVSNIVDFVYPYLTRWTWVLGTGLGSWCSGARGWRSRRRAVRRSPADRGAGSRCCSSACSR